MSCFCRNRHQEHPFLFLQMRAVSWTAAFTIVWFDWTAKLKHQEDLLEQTCGKCQPIWRANAASKTSKNILSHGVHVLGAKLTAQSETSPVLGAGTEAPWWCKYTKRAVGNHLYDSKASQGQAKNGYIYLHSFVA